MQIRLDLHIHSERSPDGRMTAQEIRTLARQAGLDGAAVCDHGRIPLSCAPEEEFLWIPGTELSTEYGHLLALFVTEEIPEGDFASQVRSIHARGGLAVLAHPFEHSEDEHRFDAAAPLLDGVEVWNSRAERKNPRANAMASALAERFSLVRTAGSDAHVPAEIGGAVLTVEAEARTAEAVKTAILAGRCTVSGRRGKAADVARSQLTKLRKTHAGPLSYAKWLLFAAKCQLKDWRSK